jgi:copper(I)-binding protein
MRIFKRNHAIFCLAAALTLPLALGSAPALAQQAKVGDIQLDGAWARATVAGQKVAGGFVKIDNKGAADKLVSARADVGAATELHTMSMDGGTMRMRKVDAIDVPAKATTELKPGGLHIMFIDLKRQLAVGETVPVTLRFEKAGEVKVDFKVQQAPAGNSGAAMSHGAHGGGQPGHGAHKH